MAAMVASVYYGPNEKNREKIPDSPIHLPQLVDRTDVLKVVLASGT